MILQPLPTTKTAAIIKIQRFIKRRAHEKTLVPRRKAAKRHPGLSFNDDTKNELEIKHAENDLQLKSINALQIMAKKESSVTDNLLHPEIAQYVIRIDRTYLWDPQQNLSILNDKTLLGLKKKAHEAYKKSEAALNKYNDDYRLYSEDMDNRNAG